MKKSNFIFICIFLFQLPVIFLCQNNKEKLPEGWQFKEIKFPEGVVRIPTPVVPKEDEWLKIMLDDSDGNKKLTTISVENIGFAIYIMPQFIKTKSKDISSALIDILKKIWVSVVIDEYLPEETLGNRKYYFGYKKLSNGIKTYDYTSFMLIGTTLYSVDVYSTSPASQKVQDICKLIATYINAPDEVSTYFFNNKLGNNLSGNVLKEDFNGSTSPFFEDYNNHWKIKNGEFTSSNDQVGGGSYSDMPDEFTDFTMSAKARWIGKSKEGGYGLLFRGVGDNFYSFIITKDGYCVLGKHNKDGWNFISDWKQFIVSSNNSYQLKVTCVENNIKCYINNKKQIEVNDDLSTKGTVGFWADAGLECSFDDFSIGPPIADNEVLVKDSFTEVINENFDGGKTDFIIDEDFQLEDGALYHSTDKEGCLHRNRIKKNFTDCAISVNAKWDGDLQNSSFGICFGSDYGFFIAQNGHYKLSKWDGSEWNNLVEWQETDLISDDYNNLKVACIGKNIMALLNNTLVINIIDNSYTGGYVGVGSSCDVDVYFDNFIVTVPTNNTDANKNLNAATTKEELNNVIFRENFDNDKTDFGLNNFWKLKNGLLACTNGEKGIIHRTRVSGKYNDCTIKVKARWDGRATNNGFGLQFGYSGEEYYIFRIAPDGHYEFSYYNGSEWEDLIPWTDTDLVKSGFNDLKITCSGKYIYAYINNNLVVNRKIDSFSGGYVGLVCAGDLDASFDDFIVTK